MTIQINAIAVVAAVVLLALPAAAVDGEILIDQAKVEAGGITPGDAPGFPATLSRPGRYKLTGNLSVPAGNDGIEVRQSDVTIDLNGFAISSPPGLPPGRYGVLAIAAGSGLRVINGTITGFQFYAVYNPEGRRPVAENLRLIGNGVGISVGAEARIRTSTIAIGGIGIICAGGCLIEQNVVSGNNGTGIEAARSTVIGNAIVSNGGYGLVSPATRTGYGNNILFGNNGGGEQIFNNGMALQLHPNVCEPNCP